MSLLNQLKAQAHASRLAMGPVRHERTWLATSIKAGVMDELAKRLVSSSNRFVSA